MSAVADSGEQTYRNPLSWLPLWPRPQAQGHRPLAGPHPPEEQPDAGPEPPVRKGFILAVALPCGGLLMLEPFLVYRQGAAPVVEMEAWGVGGATAGPRC